MRGWRNICKRLKTPLSRITAPVDHMNALIVLAKHFRRSDLITVGV
jgi:hypothetical protein